MGIVLNDVDFRRERYYYAYHYKHYYKYYYDEKRAEAPTFSFESGRFTISKKDNDIEQLHDT